METQSEVYHRVFITNTMTVHARAHPQLTHEERTLQLSNLDRKCPLLVYSVFFYRSPASHQRLQLSDGHLVSSLRRGLEEALSDWYPAAGRLSLDPQGNCGGKLNLACTNSGALLVEAVTPAKISELGDLSQSNDFCEHLVHRPPFAGCLSDMPLLVAQVTRFACGGYAIGVGTSHALFDGLAIYNFMSAWACSTVGDAGNKMIQLHVKPVHDRGRLLRVHGENLGKSEDTQVDQDGAQMKNITALDHLHQLINQATCMEYGDAPCQKLSESCKASKVNGGAFSHENFVMKTFPVSKSMVARLKSKAADGLACSSCSTFEVIAAHLFKARTKALRIPKNRMVCLQFAVNIRKRMHPPLPEGFAGNAFVLSSISCTAGELEQASLANIVERIKKAKQAITEDYVMKYLEALNAPHRSLPSLPELTIVSDWAKTPYHHIDFGLGQPAYFLPLAAPLPQVAYFVQSPSEEGKVDVRIGLLEKHVAAFHHHFLDASNC